MEFRGGSDGSPRELMPFHRLTMTSDGTLSTELQFILNAIVEGLCGVDAVGRATFCNEALLKLTGYSQEEVLGKNLHKLLHYRRLDGAYYPEEACPCVQPSGHSGQFMW